MHSRQRQTQRPTRSLAVALVCLAFVLQRMIVPLHLACFDHGHPSMPEGELQASVGVDRCDPQPDCGPVPVEHCHEHDGHEHEGHDHDSDHEPHSAADHLTDFVPSTQLPAGGEFPLYAALEREVHPSFLPLPQGLALVRLDAPRAPPPPRRAAARAPPERI